MENVSIKIVKNVMTITVDLSKRGGVSASGKSISVASSKGNKDVGQDNIKIGLNVYVPNK